MYIVTRGDRDRSSRPACRRHGFDQVFAPAARRPSTPDPARELVDLLEAQLRQRRRGGRGCAGRGRSTRRPAATRTCASSPPRSFSCDSGMCIAFGSAAAVELLGLAHVEQHRVAAVDELRRVERADLASSATARRCISGHSSIAPDSDEHQDEQPVLFDEWSGHERCEREAKGKMIANAAHPPDRACAHRHDGTLVPSPMPAPPSPHPARAPPRPSCC